MQYQKMQIQKQNISQKSYSQQVPSNCSVLVWGRLNQKVYLPQKVKQLQSKDIISVKSGGLFYLCLSRDGLIYGWGTTKYNKYGYSGQDTWIPRLIKMTNKVKLIAAGNWHSLCVDDNGKTFAVGHNKYGACGVASTENVTEFTPMKFEENVLKVSAGDGVSLMITDKGELFSCGHQERHGHLSKQHVTVPKKLKFQKNIVKANAGFTHCLAIDQDGKIYSWGDGTFFALGHGQKKDQKTPRQIKSLEGKFIVDVSCTRGQKYAHSMAVDKDGLLYTWGAGYKGKLGHYQEWDHSDPADELNPKKVNIPFQVSKCSAGGIHSMIVNQNRQAMSFGCGSDGRLGHQQSKSHKYLYREGKPRIIQSLKDYNIELLECSYYHNVCLGSKKK